MLKRFAFVVVFVVAFACGAAAQETENPALSIAERIAQAEADGVDPLMAIIMRDLERITYEIEATGYQTTHGPAVATHLAALGLRLQETTSADLLDSVIDQMGGDGALAAAVVTGSGLPINMADAMPIVQGMRARGFAGSLRHLSSEVEIACETPTGGEPDPSEAERRRRERQEKLDRACNYLTVVEGTFAAAMATACTAAARIWFPPQAKATAAAACAAASSPW